MIKKFEEYIHEQSQKQCFYHSDNYYIIDNSFKDFDLGDISIKQVKKQFIDFLEIITIPPTYGDPLLKTCKEKRLNEGIEKTFDIDIVQKSIKKKYELEDWQFLIKESENNIKVALVVPHINKNEQQVIEDMISLGYYECEQWEVVRNNLIYTVIRFDPRFPKDITHLVREMNIIKHLTPKYNFEFIRRNGFIPQHKNELFKYPPRLHFIKENTSNENIIFLGEQLCINNNDLHNTGEYVLLTLDVSLIPTNVKFIGDSCYEYGVCTENSILFDAVILTDILKYRK